MPNDGSLRLQLFMASCGVASRRACERFIAGGRVQVNGRTVTELGSRVRSSDSVAVDGKPIRPVRSKLYVALNKPRAYLCSNRDPQGRPLAVDLLRDRYPGRLFSIGRLDYLSTGLILFTNDGELARAVSHPSSDVEKEYLVEAKRPVREELLEEFARGVTVDGVRYRIKRFRFKSSTRVLIALSEGKNREIRNLFNAHNVALSRVHRTRIGGVALGKLRIGAHRALSDAEVASLRRSAGDGTRGRRD